MTSEEGSGHRSGRTLLAIARATLEEDLGGAPCTVAGEAWLQDPGACFVTLRDDQQLRGCIGSIKAYRPLIDDLRANTRAAAFGDPRFPPLEAEELASLSIEVSVLSPLEDLEFGSEEQLLEQLRPGVDGLLLECGPHRGTFLPAVWRELAEPRQFLCKLKVKAGLPEDFWSSELTVQRYTTESWREADFDS